MFFIILKNHTNIVSVSLNFQKSCKYSQRFSEFVYYICSLSEISWLWLHDFWIFWKITYCMFWIDWFWKLGPNLLIWKFGTKFLRFEILVPNFRDLKIWYQILKFEILVPNFSDLKFWYQMFQIWNFGTKFLRFEILV